MIFNGLSCVTPEGKVPYEDTCMQFKDVLKAQHTCTLDELFLFKYYTWLQIPTPAF